MNNGDPMDDKVENDTDITEDKSDDGMNGVVFELDAAAVDAIELDFEAEDHDTGIPTDSLGELSLEVRRPPIQLPIVPPIQGHLESNLGVPTGMYQLPTSRATKAAIPSMR